MPYLPQPPPYGQPSQDQPSYGQLPPQLGSGQPYGQPRYGYGVPVQLGWNVLAIIGFALSFPFFPLSPIGLVLSLIALFQIKRSGDRQKGKGIAIAGIIISVSSIVFTVIFVLTAHISTGKTLP